ncbi:MAG: NAD-dependent epimerase/dehydratase family protein [Gemmatimonadales bacterium]|nr:MAG: NAD-dependent epimerase/dehydratase family protein [Gemmatimonadales bacterium]
MKRILVTGAAGQIGTELVLRLREELGAEAVLATDLRFPGEDHPVFAGGPFRTLDCTRGEELGLAVTAHRPDTVFHLAALLSAVGERDPLAAYRVNLGGLMEVLEVARAGKLAVFTPSSIAAFGPDTPRDPTPQDTIQRPTSMYGVTKVAGELLCDYYHHRFGVDTRGLRFPGLISHSAPPGGGTTDWAVEIFHAAVAEGRYTCFLGADTQLDMMYMDDAVRAAMELMEADGSALRHRNAYNITAFQLTPGGLAGILREHIPDFSIDYDVDPVRQAIADSWPRRIDDSAAREAWGWSPRFTARSMTETMLHALRPPVNHGP